MRYFEPCYCGSFDCPSCGPLQGVPQRTHSALGSLSAEDIDILQEDTMPQTILPRDDDNQPLTVDGKRVVLLSSESGTYREWDVTIGPTAYCIVDDDGLWTVLYYAPDLAAWCATVADVDAFLTTHRLILAA